MGLRLLLVLVLLCPALLVPARQEELRWKVAGILFSGNKVTHLSILQREMALQEGALLTPDSLYLLARQSRENLLNTGLFNFVEMDVSVGDPAGFVQPVTLHYQLTERWYLWPLPFFEMADRNINAWWESGLTRRINYGLLLSHDNMRGRKEKLVASMIWGHDRSMGLVYDIPYVDKAKRWGCWGGFSHTTNHEVLYGSSEHRPLWVNDEDHVLLKETVFAAGMQYRQGSYDYHLWSLYHTTFRRHDSLETLNPAFLAPGHPTGGSYLSLHYFYKTDHRDARYYPLRGYYLDMNWQLGGSPGKGGPVEPYAVFLGSLRRYQPLGGRFFASGGVTGSYALSQSLPFYFQHGLGFDRTFVRGYEDYIFPAERFLLLKSNLKWALLPERNFQLPLIPLEQFNRLHLALYLNLFLDAGITNRQGTGHMDGRWLLGYGAGLDLVTYYDKVLRLEYSLNRHGDRGLYIHVIAPI